jgi:hypothetical protein
MNVVAAGPCELRTCSAVRVVPPERRRVLRRGLLYEPSATVSAGPIVCAAPALDEREIALRIAPASSWSTKSSVDSTAPDSASTLIDQTCSLLSSWIWTFQASRTAPESSGCQNSSAAIGCAAIPPVDTVLFFDGPLPSDSVRRSCGFRPADLAAASAASAAPFFCWPAAAAARFETKRLPVLSTQSPSATFTVRSPLWTAIPWCTCWR